MCEVKVQALEVVAALEEVMKENNLNLELASIAPTILVSGSVLWGTFQCGIHCLHWLALVASSVAVRTKRHTSVRLNWHVALL